MGDAHQWRVLLGPRQADFYSRPTGVCCHHCCHTFKGPPVGMPIVYNERKKRMVLRGVYCSVRCCLGANQELHDTRALVRPMWIRYMAKMLYGIPLKAEVRPAPPRRTLRMFGGCLTLDEFRGVGSNVDRQILLETPPLLQVIPEEESILEKLKHHQATPAIRKKAPPTRKKPGLASGSYTIQRNDTATESRKRRERLSRLGIQVV